MSRLPDRTLVLGQASPGLIDRQVTDSQVGRGATLCSLALLFSLSGLPGPGPATIRDVDFRNFVYPVEGHDVPLTNGRCEMPYWADPDVITLSAAVLSVEYGRLDDDSTEEAVVVLGFRTGGSGYFTSAYVYALRDGHPALLTTLPGGDRAIGGIHSVRIWRHELEVVRESGKTACCPEQLVTNWYRWNGSRLDAVRTVRQPVGRGAPRQ
jgi:hypothetical protein